MLEVGIGAEGSLGEGSCGANIEMSSAQPTRDRAVYNWPWEKTGAGK